MTEKQCTKCSITKTLNCFRKYNENSYSNTCKKCLNEMDKQRKKNMRLLRSETYMVKCEKCCLEKALKDFAKLK